MPCLAATMRRSLTHFCTLDEMQTALDSQAGWEISFSGNSRENVTKTRESTARDTFQPARPKQIRNLEDFLHYFRISFRVLFTGGPEESHPVYHHPSGDESSTDFAVAFAGSPSTVQTPRLAVRTTAFESLGTAVKAGDAARCRTSVSVGLGSESHSYQE
jgi:hypothetical protein